jgi:REP element-mobilizing transposase RayT
VPASARPHLALARARTVDRVTRPLRIEYPDAVYHVMARGHERDLIFLDRADREAFLALLENVVLRYGWLVHAYCLMGNHYHLVVETPKPNLALGMRQLNGVYAQRFNRRHGRVGHLLQGRYKAVVIEKEDQLLVTSRYVVLNPVRARVCNAPEDWEWSSYAPTAGLTAVPSFLHVDALLGEFAHERGAAQRAYRRFVAAGLADDLPGRVHAQLYLGDESFIATASADLEPIREVARRQWQPLPPPLDTLFAREGKPAIRTAHHEYGYTLAEIASHLGVHYATVSRALRAQENSTALSERKT